MKVNYTAQFRKHISNKVDELHFARQIDFLALKLFMQKLTAVMQRLKPRKHKDTETDTETQKKRWLKQKASETERKSRCSNLTKPSADVLTSLVAAPAFVRGHHVREITGANTAEAQTASPTSL